MHDYLYSVITDQRRDLGAAFIKVLLLGFSFVYGLGVAVVKALYSLRIFPCHSLGRPVISVGNITWGGVGKTPLVEWIARYLKETDVQPIILARGYKASERQDSKNDEVMLLQENLPDVPVVVGKDRVQKAQEALAHQDGRIFLLDDGFQQWRVKRDLDIVVIDATNPFGNHRLIPRGILREPVNSIKRANLVVITKTDIGQANLSEIYRILKKKKVTAAVVETVHQPVCFQDLYTKEKLDLSVIKNQTVHSFCGIGDPDSFEETVRSLGAHIEKNFIFRNHHWYTEEDMRQVAESITSRGSAFVITTAKDAVKLKDYKDFWKDYPKVLVLKMQIRMVKDNEKENFCNRINHLSQR